MAAKGGHTQGGRARDGHAQGGRGRPRSGTWRTHGVSVQGYRHRRNGTPCQDAWDSAVWSAGDSGPAGPVLVLAVADGAGSRPRSQEGAQLAARLATEHFGRAAAGRRVEVGDAVHDLLHSAYQEVTGDFLLAVKETGDPAEDFATTLTVVVITPDWLGHLSVGDGLVFVRAGADQDGEALFHLLPQADAASEYSNETVFLTSRHAGRWVRTDCVADPGIDAVVLSTDGLTQAALTRSRTPNASFLSAVLGPLEAPEAEPGADEAELAELLRSDRLSAVNADDKTLLRAVRI
ncbi:PP2C family serine/threonine-protein phosphatase [Streptomyces indicus]|uniref:Protein phosphatase 2C n=1 Tax=Streptomyces indicus TaxID=417292 RepID=A0A1G9BJM4_9ACTN|nr:PP2C family serine/threonine-protein phosphatase [Streptomyces indicus]SDK39647.1 Protein phosphatase 2C [Streptomyces indicus]